MPDDFPNARHPKLFIGTSNIVLPGTKQSFPPQYRQGSRLTYYSTLFNSLEVNSTFYKLPLPGTMDKWSREVNTDFRFSVKLGKEITHARELRYDPVLVDRFINTVHAIGEKKGSLLIQFPSAITIRFTAQVENLLQKIDLNPKGKGWSLCVEFRHPGWYTQETDRLLQRYAASVVVQDMPNSKTPASVIRQNALYLRFHGIAGDYRGDYSTAVLQEYAQQIQTSLAQDKAVYVYFNNTLGSAFQNAQTLQKLLLK